MLLESVACLSIENFTMAGAEKLSNKVRLNMGNSESIRYGQFLDVRSAETINQRTNVDATAEFLKGLPSYNVINFSRFQPDTTCKNTMKKSAIYFPTRDHPCEQTITTEKTTILLRYLQQQYEKKKAQLKRENFENAGPSGESPVPRKKSRTHNSQQ